MTLVIEKNVPIPAKIFHLCELDVKDSFLLKDKKQIAAYRATCVRLHKSTNLKFVTQKEIEGVRFWRVK